VAKGGTGIVLVKTKTVYHLYDHIVYFYLQSASRARAEAMDCGNLNHLIEKFTCMMYALNCAYKCYLVYFTRCELSALTMACVSYEEHTGFAQIFESFRALVTQLTVHRSKQPQLAAEPVSLHEITISTKNAC
jgi:hypothetical protein